MSTLPEQVQENVTLDQNLKDGIIVGKQWPQFDSDTGKCDHYDRYFFYKSTYGTLLIFGFFLIGPYKDFYEEVWHSYNEISASYLQLQTAC